MHKDSPGKKPPNRLLPSTRIYSELPNCFFENSPPRSEDKAGSPWKFASLAPKFPHHFFKNQHYHAFLKPGCIPGRNHLFDVIARIIQSGVCDGRSWQ